MSPKMTPPYFSIVFTRRGSLLSYSLHGIKNVEVGLFIIFLLYADSFPGVPSSGSSPSHSFAASNSIAASIMSPRKIYGISTLIVPSEFLTWCLGTAFPSSST